MLSRIYSCQQIDFQDQVVEESEKLELTTRIPIILGGKTRDLIMLRRDEYDYFTRWRKYLDQSVNSQNRNPNELRNAVAEGIGDLSDRLRTLQQKGILDAMGAALIPTSLVVGLFLEGQPFTVSGTIALSATLPMVLKAIIEQRSEKKALSKEDVYFMWLARKLHNWGKKP